MRRAAPLLLVALLAGCATPARRPASFPWKLPPRETFLAQTPPPPAPGSPLVARQVAAILALQARATPEKIASARWTYEFSVFTFSPALDPSFTAKRYPQTARFFGKLNALVQFENDFLKDTFRSPHPFQVDPRIKRFVIAVPGYDYPSYHAARCALFQRVLADLDPSRAAAFAAMARRIEEDRVFAGEHFPYSIEAGKNLGASLYHALRHDAGFRAAIARLKAAEWTPPPSADASFPVPPK